MPRADLRLWIPVAAACAAAPAQATQYLSVEQAQRALFPTADAFAPFSLPGVRAWSASRAGSPLGHVLVDEVVGKHERITYAVGVGTGGEVRDPRWRAQFVGKRRDSPLRLDDDIQNISGATLSCRHITAGVRRLLELYARSVKVP
jgi:hypothetical protein